MLGLAFAAALAALAWAICWPMAAATTGAGVTRHMWGGIALTIGVLALPAGASVVVIGSVGLRLSRSFAVVLIALVGRRTRAARSPTAATTSRNICRRR